MHILITGASGQLGRELQRGVPASVTVTAADVTEFDLTRDDIGARIDALRPDLIINTAAYTAVDKAEIEPDRAHAINARAPKELASAAAAIGARLIHISTDFVFSGNSGTPYVPNAEPAPINVYGLTKWQGEQAVLSGCDDAVIVRTAWLYSPHGNNFVKTMLRLMSERDTLQVVADQVGTPTSAASLADALWRLVARPGLRGVLHVTDAGVASWYDFAVAIREEALALGLITRAPDIAPIASHEYLTPAKRPAFSVLDKSASWRLLDITPLHWRDALRRTLASFEHPGQGAQA